MPRLTEVAALFFKLGTIGFGGPAAHLATMEEEIVQRRGWLTRSHFLDLVGISNLIPGPNATELAIHIGYHRAGWPGLIVAGISFIVPAFITTTALAAVYVSYGQVPSVKPFLTGIQAAVLAIIIVAGWRLTQAAIRGWAQAAVALGVALASLMGVGPIRALLFGCTLGTPIVYWLRRRRPSPGPPAGPPAVSIAAGSLSAGMGVNAQAAQGLPLHMNLAMTAVAVPATTAVPISLTNLALFFFKVGLVLYGTGYVLVAYLEDGLVGQYGWLTQQQLLEAIAIGQLTPGPIISSVAFIGYVVMSEHGNYAAGLSGAAVATIAVFLPSFFLVAAVNPLIPRLRSNLFSSTFLDVVNAASMGLMAAVAWKLCLATLVDRDAVVIAAIAFVVRLKWKVTPVWLVLGGACLGGVMSTIS